MIDQVLRTVLFGALSGSLSFMGVLIQYVLRGAGENHSAYMKSTSPER